MCMSLHKILCQTLQTLPSLSQCLLILAKCETCKILADGAMLLTIELWDRMNSSTTLKRTDLPR